MQYRVQLARSCLPAAPRQTRLAPASRRTFVTRTSGRLERSRRFAGALLAAQKPRSRDHRPALRICAYSLTGICLEAAVSSVLRGAAARGLPIGAAAGTAADSGLRTGRPGRIRQTPIRQFRHRMSIPKSALPSPTRGANVQQRGPSGSADYRRDFLPGHLPYIRVRRESNDNRREGSCNENAGGSARPWCLASCKRPSTQAGLPVNDHAQHAMALILG